eukprot:9883632-Alexandrium_andersonii.AAC.1
MEQSHVMLAHAELGDYPLGPWMVLDLTRHGVFDHPSALRRDRENQQRQSRNHKVRRGYRRVAAVA